MFGGNASRRNGGGGGALGGAIFNDAGNVFVRNSTFTGNFVTAGLGGTGAGTTDGRPGSDGGGAIASRNGRLYVTFTTISGNGGTGSGGGIVVVRDGAATFLTLHNTIMANNGVNECWLEGSGITTSFTGNVIEANFNCGDTVSSDDPRLGPLQNNQGPTPTMAIGSGSPAINAASTTGPSGEDITFGSDQRGQERPVGFGYDSGAYERCIDPLGEPCIILGGIGSGEDPVFLTTAVSPAGTGTTTPPPGDNPVAINSVVALTATPNTSYRFVNWTGDVVGDADNASTFIAMNDDKSVTANFELYDFNFRTIAPLAIVLGGSGSRTVTVNSMGTFDDAVALGTSGQPSGSIPELAPNPVSPAAGASTSSELSVSLGPSVVPGLYTFNVTGSSGTLFHSAAVSLTVIATPESVIDVIETLLEGGCIDSAGVSGAFTTKLAHAQAAIAAGDTQTAINVLTALLHQLRAQAGKHIEASCIVNGHTFDPGASLIAQVEALLASLGAGAGAAASGGGGGLAPANPIMGNVGAGASGNVEVAGATVSLINASKVVVAKVQTDVTGFYYFPGTRFLVGGANYTVKVTGLPRPYRKSTPASQTFTWRGTTVTASKFVLN
jgi:hypothetical protein